MKKFRVMYLLLIIVLVINVFTGCGDKAAETEVEVNPDIASTTDKDKSDAKEEIKDNEDVKVDKDETEEKKETNKDETKISLVPEEGAKLIVWESDGYEKEFVEYAIAEFNKKYPDVTIEYQPVGHTDSTQKIELDGPNGEGADVFAAPHDKLGRLVTAGLILENDALDTSEFIDLSIRATTYEKKLYGYPCGIETYALFYNKDIVDTPANTFEEIIEFSKTFNDPSNNKFALMWEAANAYYDYLFLGGYGADLFGEKGDDKNTLGFDTENGIEAMKFLQKLRCVYDVEAADTTWDPMMLAFKEGNAAYMINGPWAIEDIRDADVNFGIVKLPLLPNGRNPIAFSGIRGNYVSAFTKYPNAAKLFAAFMSSKELLQKRFEITSQIPPRNNITFSDEYNELIKGIFEQAQYAVPMPSIPEMDSYWPTMGGAFGNIWNGADVQTELEAAATAMRESFNKK